MRLLYSRTASQEYETEVIFNIAPFSDAEWTIKTPENAHTILGTWLDEHECIEIGYDMKLITTDTNVIGELWGNSIEDLLKYINEVRDTPSNDVDGTANVIRSTQTEVTIDGYRQNVPIRLCVHYRMDIEGVGQTSTLESTPIVYAEVEYSDEIDDDVYCIYDCDNYRVDMI